MYNYEINYINNMIRSNNAYIIHVPNKGQFVCYKSNGKRKNQYIKLIDTTFLQNEDDFVIWKSTNDGYEAPWGGIGLPTANFFVLCLYARN